jgi:hypothetical protein
MVKSDTEEQCPVCSAMMVKQLSAGVSTPNKDYGSPIVSQSLAINPSQIPEHNRKFPDIKIRPDGCPVFDNYKKHSAYLDAIGVVKQTKKTKRGKVIAKVNNLPDC